MKDSLQLWIIQKAIYNQANKARKLNLKKNTPDMLPIPNFTRTNTLNIKMKQQNMKLI